MLHPAAPGCNVVVSPKDKDRWAATANGATRQLGERTPESDVGESPADMVCRAFDVLRVGALDIRSDIAPAHRVRISRHRRDSAPCTDFQTRSVSRTIAQRSTHETSAHVAPCCTISTRLDVRPRIDLPRSNRLLGASQGRRERAPSDPTRMGLFRLCSTSRRHDSARGSYVASATDTTRPDAAI